MPAFGGWKLDESAVQGIAELLRRIERCITVDEEVLKYTSAIRSILSGATVIVED